MTMEDIVKGQKIALLRSIGGGDDSLTKLSPVFSGKMREGTIRARLKELECALGYINSHHDEARDELVYSLEENPLWFPAKSAGSLLDRITRTAAQCDDGSQTQNLEASEQSSSDKISSAQCLEAKTKCNDHHIMRYVEIYDYGCDELFHLSENARIAVIQLGDRLSISAGKAPRFDCDLEPEQYHYPSDWDAIAEGVCILGIRHEILMNEIDFVQDYREDRWENHCVYALTNILPIFAKLGVTPPLWPIKELEHVKSGNLSDLEKIRLGEVNEICAENGWPLFEPEE